MPGCATGAFTVPPSNANPPSATQLIGMARIVESLLRLQPVLAAAKSAPTTFHQLRGWSPRPPSAALAAHMDAVSAQLRVLWSPRLVSLLYTDALAVPVGTRPIDGALRQLPPAELAALAARARIGAALHVAALRALPPLRPSGLSRLAYSTRLIPALWALLRLLDRGSSRGAATALPQLADDAGAGVADDASLTAILHLLLSGGAHLIGTETCACA